MNNHRVVSQEEWLQARLELLEKEKAFTRLRDQLSQQRRDLPWVKVVKNYMFDTPQGQETLADLFEGRSQLVIYHFMLGPDDEEGCKSCSFWADNFNGIIPHLNQRDVTMIAVSRAPLQKLQAFKKRMGWSFKWVSSFNSDFNFDYDVSFPATETPVQYTYNYEPTESTGGESPGISVFYKNADGEVFHTYSCYARGLDMLNTAYHYLDLVPKGRDESALRWPMAWVNYHDLYAK
jgi:predicted dithiol-disulfide oxidoreductase (DUF899 family)